MFGSIWIVAVSTIIVFTLKCLIYF